MRREEKRVIPEVAPKQDANLDKFTAFIEHQRTVEQDYIEKAIKKENEKRIIRMDVDRFEEAFLPLFTREEPKYKGITLNHYVNYISDGSANIQSGASREVHLINKEGEVVCVVPPLLSHNKIAFDKELDRSMNFFEITGRAKDLSKSLPEIARKRLFQNSMERWFDIINQDEKQLDDDNLAWVKLFKYFNRVPLVNEDGEIATAPQLNRDGEPDDFKPRLIIFVKADGQTNNSESKEPNDKLGFGDLDFEEIEF